VTIFQRYFAMGVTAGVPAPSIDGSCSFPLIMSAIALMLLLAYFGRPAIQRIACCSAIAHQQFERARHDIAHG